MKRRSWKKAEQRVAEHFGHHRTPLSGEGSRHTSSDSLHPDLAIETKSNVSHPLIDQWQCHKQRAKRRNLPCLGVIIDPDSDERGLWVWHSSSEPCCDGPVIPSNFLVPVYRKRDSLRTVYENEAVPVAKEEGKTPLVAALQPHRPGFWMVARPGDVQTILSAQ